MPKLYVIGGPNGAGKTTIALKLLPKSLSVFEFVNADSIAAGLSPFRHESVALQSGRLMLERVQSLANAGTDFAFESTPGLAHFRSVLARVSQQGLRNTSNLRLAAKRRLGRIPSSKSCASWWAFDTGSNDPAALRSKPQKFRANVSAFGY